MTSPCLYNTGADVLDSVEANLSTGEYIAIVVGLNIAFKVASVLVLKHIRVGGV